jgi:hypothetical protein
MFDADQSLLEDTPSTQDNARIIGGDIPVRNLPPTVTVQAPNGGERLTAGSTFLVRWQSQDFDGEVFRHDVLYSANGGLSFTPIATNLPGAAQSFSWNVPAVPTGQGRIEVVAYDDLGRAGRDRSNANFMIEGGSTMVAISSLQPGTLQAGQTTQVSVAGSGLSTSAGDYQVVNASGVPVAGVQVLSASGTAANVGLQIQVASNSPAGNHQLRMQSPGGPVTAALSITALANAGVSLSASPSSLSVVRGQDGTVAVLLNRSGFTGPVSLAVSGLPQGVGAAFSQNPAQGSSVSLTFSVSPSAPTGGFAVTVSGSAAGASVLSTSVNLAVTAGAMTTDSGIPVPAGQALISTRFGQRRDPFTGRMQQHVGVLTGGVNANGVRFSLLRSFVPGSATPVLQLQRQGANRHTDFRFVDLAGDGNHFIACLSEKSQDDGTQDITSQIQILEPQNGGVVQGATLRSTVRPFGSTQSTVVNPDFGGMAVARVNQRDHVMVIAQNSFLTLGATVTSTVVHFFRFSNGSVQRTDFTVGERPGGATVQRSMLAAGFFGSSAGKSFLIFAKDLLFVFDAVTGQQVAVRQVSVNASQPESSDVLNPPGNTEMSQPGGRRYGQFRLVDVRGGAGQEIVIAAHSLPKPNDGNGLLGLHGMYTTLPTIQPGSSGFIQPVWGPPDAAGNSESRYRFFKDATKKADDNNPGQRRLSFVNGALLLGGTPPNGMADLGDGGVSVVVSDAPPTAVPATTPSIQVLDAVTGANKLGVAHAGAVALDVLRSSSGQVRIVAWAGVPAGQPYANGRLQVLRFDAAQRLLAPISRPLGGSFEFESGHQPVLLSFRTLDTLPEDLGLSSDRLAEFMATPVIGSVRTFLAFRTGQPGTVDAYDIDTLERVPAGGNLSLGPNAVLLAIADGLPLAAAEPVLGGSAFIVEESAPDGSRVIRFKRVTPDGRLVAASLVG